jgi:NAD(P)-dependent dehydrogenase (short-subunit alcohol dehydrogenase family)
MQVCVEKVESLDLHINNAGINLSDDLTDRSVLEQHLAVNLFGSYGMTQAFLPLLTRTATRAVSDTRRQRPRGVDRTNGHRYDPRPPYAEGLSGVRGSSHL